MMNAYALFPLSSFIINLTLLIYIFSKRARSPISKSYILYALSIGLFSGISFIILSGLFTQHLLLLHRLHSISWLSTGFLFLRFTLTLVERPFSKKLNLCWAVILSLFALTLTTPAVIEGLLYFHWGVSMNQGPMFLPAVILTVVIPFAISFYLIWKKKNSSDCNETKKKQCDIILLGTTIGLLLAIISDVIFPLFESTEHLFRVATTVTIIQSLCMFIAVYYYQLLSINIGDAASYLFKHLNDGVLILDTNSKVIHINQAALKLLDTKYSDIIGIHISSIIQDPYFKVNEAVYDYAFKQKGKRSMFLITIETITDWHDEIGKIALIHKIKGLDQ